MTKTFNANVKAVKCCTVRLLCKWLYCV